MSKSNGLEINPETGDYVVVDGKPVIDESLKQPAYIRMKAKRNTWMYAPDDKWGSDFHLIKKSRTTQAATREINTAEKSLDPLIDDGRAADVLVEVSSRVRGQTQLKTTITEEVGEAEQTILIPIGE